MVGMAPLPVGKDHHPRSLFTHDASDLQPVLPGVFYAPIGNVQSLAEVGLENPGCLGGFTGAILGCAARAHLAVGQIENPRELSAFRRLEQSSAAGLLHIIAV